MKNEGRRRKKNRGKT